MHLITRLVIIILCILPCSATEVLVEQGRIALIDLGALIKGEIQSSNPEILRTYKVSGMEDEDYESIIAIQAIKETGESDLIVSTSSGLHQFRVIINKEVTEDLNLNPNKSRLKVYNKPFILENQRASLISLPAYINKKILVSDPDLISVDQFLDYYDDNYLKVFSIKTLKNNSVTDLVLPSQTGVYKLSIRTKENVKHVANINLI